MRGVVVASAMGLLLATPLVAQEREAPPPGGIVERTYDFAVGFGVGSLDWDADAPFDDATILSVAIERRLWSAIRGRASLGWGMTDLLLEPVAETRIYALDLALLVGPEIGPLGVYGLGGVGAVVTVPDEPEGFDLPTRSQSQVTFGAGARVRLARRWEGLIEITSASFRLADPVDAENRETDTIHNLRWEGRVSWLF